MTLPELSAPPDQGITAWMEDNGLYARLYPPIGLILFKRIAGMMVLVIAVMGGMVAIGYGEDFAAHPWYIVYPSVFVVMVALVQHMAGFFPTEVAVDDQMLVWDSDRIPLHTIGSCEVESDGRLVVRDRERNEIASVSYLRPDVAAWLSDAINQSRAAAVDSPGQHSSRGA